jgi:hypothetical protein
MIDYVYGSEYLTVTSNKGAQPYINMSSSQPMIGALSYDPSIQQMKVFDGNYWQTIGGGSASINLTSNAINILKWAEKKMLAEAECNKLAETNPTVRDLMDQIKKKEEQLSIVLTLIKEEEKV